MLTCVVVFIVDSTTGDSKQFNSMVAASALSPASVFGEVELYRIVSAAFTHLSVLHVGMNMMSLVSLGSSLEPLFGTMGFFFLTLLYVVLVGILFLGLATCLALTVTRNYWWTSAAGFSGVLFSYAVNESSLSPLPTRTVFGLFTVPTRLYPWVLMFVLQILIPNVSFLGHLSGLLVGLLHSSGLLSPFLPSLATIKYIEQSPCFSPILRLPSYRPAPSQDPVVIGPLGSGMTQAASWLARVLRPITDRLPRLPQLSSFWRGGRGLGGATSTDAQFTTNQTTSPRRIVNGRLLSGSAVVEEEGKVDARKGVGGGDLEEGFRAADEGHSNKEDEFIDMELARGSRKGGDSDDAREPLLQPLPASAETITITAATTTATTHTEKAAGSGAISSPPIQSSSSELIRDRELRAKAAEARLAQAELRGTKPKQQP